MPAPNNPFFDFAVSAYRFVARTLARAEDVNARFDEVSAGFTGVKTRLDTADAGITALQASKAPLANPAITGGATIDGKAVATQEYAQSLAMQSALPANASQRGMLARVSAAGVPGWADWWGTPVKLTAADNNFQLVARTTYLLNSAGGSFNVLLPPNPADGDWVLLIDISGALSINKVVLKPGTKKLRNLLEDMDLDVGFDVVMPVYDIATTNWIEYE